ncbi:hypothetical protein RHSIM_Rhsim02G0050800 [Rhododendron simsii]|uniref:SWIM-type domain-containing protein n=1 Tax=Rhododendron simsii TaxID=118357 RepID=A0A834LWB6_RHOSS|nr:hypothetical protein RHSIM_Rhsim02G0050800 [Rhododendron simsii]
MEDAAILLCRRADKTIAIILSQNLDFESLVSRLSHKWKDLTQGCFEISYTLDGHPNYDVDCDEDLIALRTLAKKFRIGRIDVCIHDVTGSNTSLDVGECGDGSSSSLNVVGSGELISEIDNGSEMTLYLFNQERNQLKSDAWRFAIKGVDQVFIGGASAFRDSLSKYSLVHGFDFIYAKNDAETVKARCRSLHCTWFVKAKVEKPSGLFRIKELMNEHSCGAASLSTSSSRSTSGLIGRIFSEAIRLSPSKRPVDVRKELKKDYGTWNVVRSNGDLYEVQCDPSVGVDIARRSCSCGDWQLNMFPCVHGVCALKKRFGRMLMLMLLMICFFLHCARDLLDDLGQKGYHQQEQRPEKLLAVGADRLVHIIGGLVKSLWRVDTRGVKCSRSEKIGRHNRTTCTKDLRNSGIAV